jgi:hypothetical protein
MSAGIIAGLPLQRNYTIHGMTLTVRGDPGAAALLHARLRHFAAASSDDGPDLAFEFCGFDRFEEHVVDRPPGPGRPVHDYLPLAEVLYFDHTDQLYVDYDGRAWALAGLSDGRVQVSFLRHNPGNAFMAAHALFTIPFMELGKRRGRYPLHAAALCLGERTLILPGASGSGKTTLVLALLRAGFELLADDIIFLAVGRDGLQALGFADTAGVTDETVSLFPEVGPHLCHSAPRMRKRLFQPEHVYGSPVRMTGRPAAVVFPRVAHADTSVLAPLGHDEAFFALLGQLRPTETRSAQGHLEALARLAADCPCYRMETGRDFHAVSSLLRGLLG